MAQLGRRMSLQPCLGLGSVQSNCSLSDLLQKQRYVQASQEAVEAQVQAMQLSGLRECDKLSQVDLWVRLECLITILWEYPPLGLDMISRILFNDRTTMDMISGSFLYSGPSGAFGK